MVVWAESEAEALDFIKLIENKAELKISNIYVAKRSSGKRDVGSKYINGVYYPYDLNRNATVDKSIIAPKFITDLVQWCSPDLILSTETKALISIETTYHTLAFNNVAQRIPRQIRSAKMGVPSVIFQKVDYKFKVGIGWFTKTFLKASKIYSTPCLALLFDDSEFLEAKLSLIKLLNARINNEEDFNDSVNSLTQRMEKHAENYNQDTLLRGRNSKPRTWLNMDDNWVEVIIGVRDNCALAGIKGFGCQGNDVERREFRKTLKFRKLGSKGCVWLSKGTGGMDPYPGLVKMAEILLCYNDEGKRVKKLKTYFSSLPKDFWWFEHNRNEIYYRLINEFSEKISYSEIYK